MVVAAALFLYNMFVLLLLEKIEGEVTRLVLAAGLVWPGRV